MKHGVVILLGALLVTTATTLLWRISQGGARPVTTARSLAGPSRSRAPDPTVPLLYQKVEALSEDLKRLKEGLRTENAAVATPVGPGREQAPVKSFEEQLEREEAADARQRETYEEQLLRERPDTIFAAEQKLATEKM